MTISFTAMLGAIGLVVDFGLAYRREEAANSAAPGAIVAVTAGSWCGTGAD